MSAATCLPRAGVLRAAGYLLMFAQTSLILVAASAGQAQVPTPAERAPLDAEYQTQMAKAHVLARGNDPAAVEREVAVLNRSKPETAAWHMETAQRLIQVAGGAARDGKAAAVPALATSALRHAEQAASATRIPRTQSAAKTLAAFIQERYLADPVGALANYRAAAQLAPAAATKAREAADRIEKAQERLRDRNTPGGK